MHWNPITAAYRRIHLCRGVASLHRELLTARCRRRPLATLADEAHTLDLEVGRTLLNASQRVRDKAPFLLVLAGTPGMAACRKPEPRRLVHGRPNNFGSRSSRRAPTSTPPDPIPGWFVVF